MENPNLATELFIKTCCSQCTCGSQNESSHIVQTDNMGRPVMLED
jgi:hypothetical protein